MLSGGELVGVWPEGFKGIGKPFSERYKLQRFGRGGFVSAALRTGVPIVPLSVVGAEEIYPLVGNLPALARLLGVPYIPITPLFPLLPREARSSRERRLNRPGFDPLPVICRLVVGGLLSVVLGFGFGGWSSAEAVHESAGVEPVDPVGGGGLDVADGGEAVGVER